MKDWAKQQIEKALNDGKKKTKNAGHRSPGKASDVEFSVLRSSVRKDESPAFTSRVDISIVSYRIRLADPDGLSRKAAIDGLVKCNVLANDSAKEIKSIRHRQVKVKNLSEEKTVIKIKEAT